MSGPATTARFADWVRPHWPDMDRLALRLVGDAAAQDVVQEALAAAWRSWDSYDPARGEPRTWLLAIVANKARDHRRRTTDHAVVVDEIAVEPRGPDVSIDMSAALARLTHRRRTAVALFYYLGLSVDECARVMDCSAGTVKSTLSDARDHLRKLLGEDYA